MSGNRASDHPPHQDATSRPEPGDELMPSTGMDDTSQKHNRIAKPGTTLSIWKRAKPANFYERILAGDRFPIGEHVESTSMVLEIFDDVQAGRLLLQSYEFDPRDPSLQQTLESGFVEADTIDEVAAQSLPAVYTESSISTQTTFWDTDVNGGSFLEQMEDGVFYDICDWFRQWLYRCFQSQASGEQSSSSSAPPGGSRGLSDTTGNKKRNGPCKRSHKPDGSGNEDDDCGKGNAGPHKRIKNDDIHWKLACPFYKHNWRNHYKCVGKGFPTVHRLKEHLYKHHTLPGFQCLRCYSAFEGELELSEHARTQPCSLRERPIREIESISRTQMEQLKKRSKNNESESQRWIRVYSILFPSEESDIPSPYVEPKECSDQACPLQDDFHDMERYFVRECPRHIAYHLEGLGDQLKAALTDQARSDLVNLIPKILTGLNRDYHEKRRAVTSTTEAPDIPIAEASAVEERPANPEGAKATNQALFNLQMPDAPFFTAPKPTIPGNFEASLDWLSFIDFSNGDLDHVSFEDFLNPPEDFPHHTTDSTSDPPKDFPQHTTDSTSEPPSGFTITSERGVSHGISSGSSHPPQYAEEQCPVNQSSGLTPQHGGLQMDMNSSSWAKSVPSRTMDPKGKGPVYIE